MQPYVHARSSAARRGREWQEDLPIHEFMDIAKHACPDLRHRIVLHNADLGPALAKQAFPLRPEALDVALLHVQEDLGWMPSLTHWLERCEPARLPPLKKTDPTGDLIIRSAVDYHGLTDPTPIQQVWDLLSSPLEFAPEHPKTAEALLMSSVGPILARAVLGPPQSFQRTDGRSTIVDFSWVAEGIIVAKVGVIHPLHLILQCFIGPEPRRP